MTINRADESTDQLSPMERSALVHEESAIEQGADQVAKALVAIRDRRLYRADYPTFEEYCRERWGMTRQHANRQIVAAEVAAALEPIGSKVTESQARELADLRNDPEALRETYRQASEATDGNVTAFAIRKARGRTPETPEPTIPQGEPVSRDVGSGLAPEGEGAEVSDLTAVSEQDAAPPRPPVTGIDGKTYPPTTPRPRPRRAITDQFFDAAFDLTKTVDRIDRLVNDHRFPQNAEKVATKNRDDLLRARDVLDDVLTRMP